MTHTVVESNDQASWVCTVRFIFISEASGQKLQPGEATVGEEGGGGSEGLRTQYFGSCSRFSGRGEHVLPVRAVTLNLNEPQEE